jgi:23S rRNA (cytidine1920-2'-O)/16S rRNA (cytidine1409-2'-O)-methyltransferase
MKERIDVLLVEKKFVESRTKAQWLIKNGYVFVDGKKIHKPGKKVENSRGIQLIKNFPYVGRGGLKLEGALKKFSILVEGKTCADIGASVGGFTDCLLKHRAERVYSIDKATDLLHPSLINKEMQERVIPVLGTDARNSITLDEKVDICTIDITFTSLKAVFPNVRKLLKKDGDIIALVKPIFETDYEGNRKFSIIKNPQQLYQILIDLIQWCYKNQFFLFNLIKSPVLGKEGSIEFFLHLRLKESDLSFDLNELVKRVLK